VKICNNAPIISHLLFVDDCFIFFGANVAQASKMKDMLSIYEKSSGQAVNLQKSEFFCSRNVLRAEHNKIANTLGDSHLANLRVSHRILSDHKAWDIQFFN